MSMVIYPDRINTIVADEEAAGFEVENLLDDYPSNLWMGTSQDAKLTFTMSGGAAGVGIANTNAKIIVFTLKDASDVLIESSTYNLTGIFNLLQFITNIGYYPVTDLVIPYTYQAGVHKVDLELDTDSVSTDIQAGIARAGFVYAFRDPKAGIRHGLTDFSVKDKYNNESRYYALGSIVHNFSTKTTLLRDTEFFVFLLNLAKQFGETPQMWKLTDLNSNVWSKFLAMEGMPSGDHSYPEHSILSVNWEEVV